MNKNISLSFLKAGILISVSFGGMQIRAMKLLHNLSPMLSRMADSSFEKPCKVIEGYELNAIAKKLPKDFEKFGPSIFPYNKFFTAITRQDVNAVKKMTEYASFNSRCISSKSLTAYGSRTFLAIVLEQIVTHSYYLTDDQKSKKKVCDASEIANILMDKNAIMLPKEKKLFEDTIVGNGTKTVNHTGWFGGADKNQNINEAKQSFIKFVDTYLRFKAT